MPKKTRRTTHRTTGRRRRKVYAVRDRAGKFKDIQVYQHAHRNDLRRRSKAERKSK